MSEKDANDLRAAATTLFDNASDIGFVSGVLEGILLTACLAPNQIDAIAESQAAIQLICKRNQQAIEALAVLSKENG